MVIPTRFILRALILAILLLGCCWTVPRSAEAAHPLRLTDYSPQSRITLEIGGGQIDEPLPADFIHYLLEADINVYQGLHIQFGIPFSGYSGIDGGDNFIRGNLLLGATYRMSLTGWFQVGFGLKFYLPTYERAEIDNPGLAQDPRRAVLSHWHYRFGYAMEDHAPMAAEMALLFEHMGFFTQLEGAFTYAPIVDEPDGVNRKDNVLMLQYGLSVGYDILGYVELAATLAGLCDPSDDGANLGDIVGLAADRPRSFHVVSVGPRAQYKWFAIRFEAAFPLEKRFRQTFDPYYTGALQVQFP